MASVEPAAVTVDRADPMVPTCARVLRRVVENDDVVTLTITRPASHARPAPGHFSMLGLPGVGEVPISVSAFSDDDVTHTIRGVGAVTRALCALRKGDPLLVRGPFGRPWQLDEDVLAHDVLVVAGGIGLAPLFPAIDIVTTAAALKAGRRRIVVYGARAPRERILTRRLAALRRRMAKSPLLELEEIVDAPTPDWDGHVGVVTQLLPRLLLDAKNTRALVCGPEIMMRFAARALVDLGVDPEHVQVSIERPMKCGISVCGHCQYGPLLVCRDGAVTTLTQVAHLWSIRGL